MRKFLGIRTARRQRGDIEVAREAGFECALAASGGSIQPGAIDRYALPRLWPEIDTGTVTNSWLTLPSPGSRAESPLPTRVQLEHDIAMRNNRWIDCRAWAIDILRPFATNDLTRERSRGR